MEYMYINSIRSSKVGRTSEAIQILEKRDCFNLEKMMEHSTSKIYELKKSKLSKEKLRTLKLFRSIKYNGY